MVIPFMSVYLTAQLGFGKTQAGIVLFSFGLGALIGSNLGGFLSDRIGNFKVMALSLLGCGVGFISIIFFEDFISLCLILCLTAIFSSMFSPAAFSAVTMWGNPNNQTRGFSLLRMAINLGIAIGPAVGGFLAYKYGYNWIFILDGITCFLAVIVLFIVLGHRNVKTKKEITKKASTRSPFKDGFLLLFLFFNLINMVAFFQILFSVPVYFKEVVKMNEIVLGYFFTANGLLVFLLEMPLVYIIEQKKKFLEPMIAGAILIGISFACLNIFSNPIVAIILFSLLIALGEVINFPLIPTLAMKRADKNNQGQYMGLVSTMFAMAFLLAPVAGLPVIDIVGYDVYYYLAASLSILSGICLWLMRRHLRATEGTSSAKGARF